MDRRNHISKNKMLLASQASRRDVLKAGAPGALALAGGLALPNAGWAASPKKGGHVRIGVRGGSNTDSPRRPSRTSSCARSPTAIAPRSPRSPGS